MKKVVLAFDSFKGCISAHEACQAAARGVRAALPDANIVQIPLSDGGEGLVECARRMLPTKNVTIKTHGPLMERLEADYAISVDSKTAYMEMASTSGLTLVPLELRDPTKTTTYGVGEMIADAVGRGCQRIVMGIGGSATCDGGRGAIEALRDCRCLEPKCEVIVACDVNNPLFGKNGAAYVFAPQKGATHEQVQLLDRQLRAFAKETELAGFASPELAKCPGAGAAGGLGYSLLAYLKAELRSGIDIMLNLAHFDDAIKDADLVITGEGKSDEQTLMGKVPFGVLNHSAEAKVPVWLLSGGVDDSSGVLSDKFDLVRSINEDDIRPLYILMQPEVAKENLSKKVRDLFLNMFPEL